MEEDERNGLVPFFVSATLGTTSCCSFDNLQEIGPVVQKFPCVWLHVDGAYAGNAFICPELKPLLAGIEYADSFNTNPNKWLLVNFDCSTMWVRDRILLTSALVVDPLYLQHGYSDTSIDYRHWGVPLSRRFRSLKLWFVMRTFGISGLQEYIRHHIKLAKQFEALVLEDKRFEVCNEVKLGLVCFRLKYTDKLNEKLLSAINASGKLHMVPAHVNDKYVIRFCAVAQNATADDVTYAWKVIVEFAEDLLEKEDHYKEAEVQDDVFEILDRKRKETLAHKRSFFVRMVSDPKIYNPSIAKGTVGRRHTQTESIASPDLPVQPNLTSSWISWPIAFILQGMQEDGASSNVPIRFRHLDTKVRLPAGGNRVNGGSPSPEGELLSTGSVGGAKSPKRSPIFPRKEHD